MNIKSAVTRSADILSALSSSALGHIRSGKMDRQDVRTGCPRSVSGSTLRVSHLPYRNGFMLLEIMLAVFIFGLVVAALAKCLGNTASTMLNSNRETQVRLGLQSHLAENRLLPVQIGTADDAPDPSGIFYQHEWRPLTLQNQSGTTLPNLYELIERASWTQGGQPMTHETSIYLYLPPQ
jgi:hypothetical protein